MSILRYFKPSSTLPAPSEVQISPLATKEANKAAQEELNRQQAVCQKCKRKTYTSFSNETRADIGKYAAENGNTAALKRLFVYSRNFTCRYCTPMSRAATIRGAPHSNKYGGSTQIHCQGGARLSNRRKKTCPSSWHPRFGALHIQQKNRAS